MVKRIIITLLPLFVIWVFAIAISHNFDVRNLHVNLGATFKRLNFFASASFTEAFNRLQSNFQKVLDGSMQYALDRFNIWSSFESWYDFLNISKILEAISNSLIGVGALIWSLCEFVFYVGYGIVDFVIQIFKLVGFLFEFLFNPVVYS